MSYRDDLDAAVGRADAVDRENARLVAEHARLTSELAEARETIGRGSVWLGDAKTRLLFTLVASAGLVLAIGAGVYGRVSAECPEPVVVHRVPPPFTIGTMVADGAELGHWTLNATRCVPRADGIELTAVGQENYIIWLTNNVVEVEFPDHDYVLKKVDCTRKLELAVVAHDGDPKTYDGHVELDCLIDRTAFVKGNPRDDVDHVGNRLQGRIEFQHCR